MAIIDSNRKRILVVEDDPHVRASLELLLSSRYDVTAAENGVEALSKINLSMIENVVPDLIILDLLMPKMGGLEFLEEFKLLDADSQVIVLTATNSVSSAVEAMKSGASDYISKPFVPEDLLNLIEETAQKSLKARKEKVLLSESQVRRGIGNILEEALQSFRSGDLESISSEKNDSEALKSKVLSGEIALSNLEEQIETKLILEALEQTNYIQTKAADKLGVTRRVLKYKIDKLGLSDFLSKKKESLRKKSTK